MNEFRPVMRRVQMSREENFERHLKHECGHVWIGKERHGAELLSFNINPDGESDVLLGKIPKDIDASYRAFGLLEDP